MKNFQFHIKILFDWSMVKVTKTSVNMQSLLNRGCYYMHKLKDLTYLIYHSSAMKAH